MLWLRAAATGSVPVGGCTRLANIELYSSTGFLCGSFGWPLLKET